MEDRLTNDETLTTLCEYFEQSEELSTDARKSAERDRDYYDGKQLTAEERAELAKRGQPEVIINRIKRKVNFLRGLEQEKRTDPKAFPRTPKHEEDAQGATDAIRYVCENNRYDQIRSTVWDNMIVEGFGGVEVLVEKRGGEMEVVLKRWRWDRLFFDPHSSEPDFSDAKYVGGVTWMDIEDAKAKWPGKGDVLESTLSSVAINETYDDKPKFMMWSDPKRKRVRICQIYFRQDGEWYWATYTKGGFLRSPKMVPFVDEDGATECPMLLRAAYVDRDNNRYGEVRELISPQDEINKRRSKALHLISMRQVHAEEGAVDDIDETRNELAKPDGLVVTNPGFKFEVLPTGDMAVSQFQLLAEAKAEIDLAGPNAAMQGKDERAPSGRAILASQQGGYIELAPVLDGLREFDVRVYKQIWNRIRQFWTGERWIRVTDDERNLKWVGLNQPMMLADRVKQDFGGQIPPQIMGDPRLGQQIGIRNNVAEMEVDIILEDVPDTVTIQHEQFQELASMAGAGVPIPPDILIEASSLRNKKALLERMQSGEQAPDPKMVAEERKAKLDEGELVLKQEQMRIKAEGEAADRVIKEEELKVRRAELGIKARESEAATAVKQEELNIRRAELGLKARDSARTNLNEGVAS